MSSEGCALRTRPRLRQRDLSHALTRRIGAGAYRPHRATPARASLFSSSRFAQSSSRARLESCSDRFSCILAMRVQRSNALRQYRLIRNFDNSSHWTCSNGRCQTQSRGLHGFQQPSDGLRRGGTGSLPGSDRHTTCDRQRRHARAFSVTTLALDTVKDVAILGGGITGLATAHYLSEEYPDAKITLYESKPHLGGWMNTKAVDVGNGEVMFESGPRSLRPQAPNGTLALRLVRTCAVGFYTAKPTNDHRYKI